MSNLRIKLVSYAKAFSAIDFVRIKVFQEEQGISADLEFDGLDATASHFLAYWREEPVGTLRMRSIGIDVCKVERLAVLAHSRRKGIGRKLMEQALTLAEMQKKQLLVVHAQEYICPLYHKLGFQRVGDPFIEAGILHLKLQKQLFD